MRCITFLLPTKHNLALTLCVLLTFMFAHKLSSAVKELLIPLYAPRFHLQELYNDYAMATALDATHDEKYRAGLAYLIARLVASVPIAYGLSCFVCALLIRFPPSKDVRCSRLSLKARLIAITCAGAVAMGLIAVVLHHPYSRVLIWTDLEFDKYVKEKDRMSLLTVVNARIIPYKIRSRAFELLYTGALNRPGKGEHKGKENVFLGDRYVDRLSKEIGQTNDYSHGLRAPLVEGGVLNPNIVRIVLDSGRNSTVRYSAFCHMLDFDDISSNHYRQLEVVWQSIEDVELKCDINAYVAIYYFRNGWLPPDAFEELGKIPADKCNQKFSEGIQDESA